jgi:hypothetical protein
MHYFSWLTQHFSWMPHDISWESPQGTRMRRWLKISTRHVYPEIRSHVRHFFLKETFIRSIGCETSFEQTTFMTEGLVVNILVCGVYNDDDTYQVRQYLREYWYLVDTVLAAVLLPRFSGFYSMPSVSSIWIEALVSYTETRNMVISDLFLRCRLTSKWFFAFLLAMCRVSSEWQLFRYLRSAVENPLPFDELHE